MDGGLFGLRSCGGHACLRSIPCNSSDNLVIRSAETPLSSARVLISVATTVKPAPYSPARAASIRAFSASSCKVWRMRRIAPVLAMISWLVAPTLAEAGRRAFQFAGAFVLNCQDDHASRRSPCHRSRRTARRSHEPIARRHRTQECGNPLQFARGRRPAATRRITEPAIIGVDESPHRSAPASPEKSLAGHSQSHTRTAPSTKYHGNSASCEQR